MNIEPQVAAAIVTGIFGLTIPFLTFMRERIFSSLGLQRVHTGRRAALTGKWVGETTQDIGDEPHRRPGVLTVTLKSGRRRIDGSGQHSTSVAATGMVLQGGMIHDKIVSLTYRSEDDGRIQTGTLVCLLGADGKTLRGRYVGYGPYSDNIVSGTVDLKKV